MFAKGNEMTGKNEVLSGLISRLMPSQDASQETASGLKVVELQAEDLQRVSGGARSRGFSVSCPTCSGGCEDDCGYDPFG
jgi:hypothetical protein